MGRTYLLEGYLPRTSPGGAEAVAARARSAVDEMRRARIPIRFLRLLFLPDDELCFCLYEARSIGDVAEAGRRAELGFERIQQAVQLPATCHTADLDERSIDVLDHAEDDRLREGAD